jgi:DNA-binding NtrC family response regulator
MASASDRLFCADITFRKIRPSRTSKHPDGLVRAPVRESSSFKGGSESMKKILVVGKDLKACEDLRKYFDPQGHTLIFSHDPKNAVSSVTNLRPDLIITDLNSSHRWVIEVLRDFKKSSADIPIIAITDNSCDQASIRTIREQVYGLAKRPIQPERISFMVKEALSTGVDRTGHTTAPAGKRQKDPKGVTKLSGLSETSEKLRPDYDKTRQGYSVGEKSYDLMFDQLLSPIYDEILVNSKGKIYDRLLSGLEKSLIFLTLRYCNHNQVKASQLLGISRNTLRERIKRYDLW